MRKFLKKFILAFSLYLCLTVVVRQFVPFYYGNDQLTEKFKLFNTNPDKFNTVFIGPSTFNRHINPVSFDRLTRSATTSFSLAADATPFAERSYLIENFIKKYEVKNIFVQVSHSAYIHENNLHTLRSVHYHDFKRLRHLLGYRSSDFDELQKHILSFFENGLFMFRLKHLLASEYEPSNYNFKNRGYIPMDVEDTNTKKGQNRSFARKQAKYESKVAKFTNFRKPKKIKTHAADIAIVEECKRLEKIAQAQGVNLYFVFLPSDILYYKAETLNNKLYLGDGVDFPEYFDFQNRYNFGHLNKDGAELFTERLANTFLELGSD